MPAIVTNHTCTLAARLENGEVVVGQCQISHPPRNSNFAHKIEPGWEDEMIHPSSLNIAFSKNDGSNEESRLQATIESIYYINAYGQEICPKPNPEYINSIDDCEVMIYSCGSLWTSIVPCLALRGVADSIISSTSLKYKVLLLNKCNDRETEGYDAVDYIMAITSTLNKFRSSISSESQNRNSSPSEPSVFVTHIVYLKDGEVKVDTEKLERMGVQYLEMALGNSKFDASTVQTALDYIRVSC